MDNTFFSVYFPILIVLMIVFSQQSANNHWIVIKRRKGERGLYHMSEYLKKYIGKKCFISTGSFGSSFTGKIVAVEDKWVELETKEGKPIEVVNLDFVQRIRITK